MRTNDRDMEVEVKSVASDRCGLAQELLKFPLHELALCQIACESIEVKCVVAIGDASIPPAAVNADLDRGMA